MKKSLIIISALLGFGATAQEHFSGINTSQRSGIINAGINPAELVNISTQYDINLFALNVKASNNQIGFSDLVGGGNLGELIFQGNNSVDLRLDGEITGPGIAYRINNWGFALTTKAHAKLDLVAVNSNLGDALTNSVVNSYFSGVSMISNPTNQRMSGTSWGEVGFSAARILFEDSSHKINAGASFKILFPGSYMNFGADKFSGKITNDFGELTLTDAEANLNVAYSGNLGESFTEFGDYAKSLFGKPNGFSADFGANYQLKDNDGEHYKLNLGLSLRNIGGMTFKSANNSQTNYVLSVQGTDSLNLNQFQNAKSMSDVESLLLASGFLNKSSNEKKSFKVKLPTMFSAYADVKIVPSFYVTLFTQQKVKKDEDNGQIAGQNTISLTPRFTVKNYEVYLPLSQSEFSGFATGIGFRAYGFYIGSGSIITALINDSKQADAYIGYGFRLD